MFLGLNPGAWLFWANVLAMPVLTAIAYRRFSPLPVIAALMNAAAAALLLTMQGACVLPQSTTVEFHQGMTLCPGQAAKVRIEIEDGPDDHTN